MSGKPASHKGDVTNHETESLYYLGCERIYC